MTLNRMMAVVGISVVAGVGAFAGAATFTMTAVTNTTPNFGGTIAITGTITMNSGESLLSPLSMSSWSLPFNAGLTAGFNGPGQGWDAGFLAWNGIGTYSGAIVNHVITPGNFGYSGGMPLGLYGTNPLGPGGLAGITLNYVDTNGALGTFSANYAINVVPAPGPIALLGLAGLVSRRRRR
ncbi:MAG: hypothetical protein SFY95_02130 [Planctomycetota bacterium]|nr:hypothetical protein [Planctomycetota bacterium]